jgi:hypothetical protein
MRFSAILSGPHPVSALQRWVIANSRHGSICTIFLHHTFTGKWRWEVNRKIFQRMQWTRGLPRDVVYLRWPIAPSYMRPNAGGGGELQCLSQWVQLYTGAQINFGDLSPHLTHAVKNLSLECFISYLKSRTKKAPCCCKVRDEDFSDVTTNTNVFSIPTAQ